MRDLILDIDVDFFYGPPEYWRSVVDPERFRLWLSPAAFIRRLAELGLVDVAGPCAGPCASKCSGLAMADHRYAYFYWKKSKVNHALAIHFDAHSDCYLALSQIVHCGNFLRKAIEEGIIASAIWVVPSWFRRDPDHPIARDALESQSNGVYQSLPLRMIAFDELSTVAPEIISQDVYRRFITLANSPSFVPESSTKDVFLPLMAAFGMDHSMVPSAA